ncbi:MAG: Maf family protein [Proteobacteria bacterium]|nr:Maf family protein [Pseudomonadota bacterium]
MTWTLLLASASPRRRELLERIGIVLDICPADVDETPHSDEAPLDYVSRMAESKADVVAASRTGPGQTWWVLGADTIVEIDGAIVGKARGEAEAIAMLERLVGRVHRVATAFAVRASHGIKTVRTVTTEVVMRPASRAEITDYVAAGEWRGKAGAYAIQGMAAALVTEVRGSVTNVIGLPLAEVVAELARLGAGGPSYRQGVPAQ